MLRLQCRSRQLSGNRVKSNVAVEVTTTKGKDKDTNNSILNCEVEHVIALNVDDDALNIGREFFFLHGCVGASLCSNQYCGIG